MRGFDECLKKPQVLGAVGQVLRMPLHRQQKAAAGVVLGDFQQPVRREADRPKPAAGLVRQHALVVPAVHFELARGGK